MKLNTKAKKMVMAHCLAIKSSVGKSGSGARWPMPILKTTNEASIYSEPVLALKFYYGVKKLLEKGYSLQAIAKLFPYPSPLARLTMSFRSRKIWSLSYAEQLELANYLAEILAMFYKSKSYCLDGKNLLYDNKEIQNNLSKILNKKYLVNIKEITGLDGRMWIYSEMIFNRWHNLGHEFHGPYNFSGKKLLIKEWHDLQGFGQGPFKNFPYKKIICYELYNNNQIKFDLHNRMISVKPFSNTLLASWVEVDGHLVSSAKLKQIIKVLDGYIVKGAKFLAKKTAKDLKLINAFVEFYSIKELTMVVFKDWRPPKELLAKIAKEKLGKKEKNILDKLQLYYPQMNKDKILKILFNPEVKFK